ncbi:MAG: hypothetical protein ACXWVI_02120 [Methyloceanibacter sp.]
MATLKQAEAARDQFADELAKRGAHAVGVEQDRDSEGWVVVAYVEPAATFSAPKMLSARQAGRVVSVPLLVQRERGFVAE